MKLAEELKKVLDDPEQMERFVNILKRKQYRKQKNINVVKTLYHDKKSFNKLVERIIDKHDEKWVDRCYKNGIMPHPWNLLYALFDLSELEGTQIEPLDELTENFPSSIYEYNDWQFSITHGQGSVCGVYYKKELKYRD